MSRGDSPLTVGAFVSGFLAALAPVTATAIGVCSEHSPEDVSRLGDSPQAQGIGYGWEVIIAGGQDNV